MIQKLTPRQERFAGEYLVDLNATRAAVRAGYARRGAEVTGSRLLRYPNVAAAIAAAKRERAQSTRIDSDWVLKQAVELHLRCMQEIKPALHPKTRRQLKDAEGNALFTFNAAAASRALELIGKHIDINAFRESITVGGEVSLVERLLAGRARVARDDVIDVIPEDVAAIE
jgi:phage terminase small subunit